jgi:hypothetical protein
MILWRITCTDDETGQLGLSWCATKAEADEAARPLRRHPLGGRSQGVKVSQDRVPTENKIALARWLTELSLVITPSVHTSTPLLKNVDPGPGIGDNPEF